jgi:hypothetical protein
LGSESETCVGSRVRLVGVSISFEKNFYRLPFTPPSLSGSSYRTFSYIVADGLDDDVAEAEANRLDVLTTPATDILIDDFVEILFPDAIPPPPPTPSSPESSWPLRPLNFS